MSAVSRWQIFIRGILLHCPNCGCRGLFKQRLEYQPSCTTCGFSLLRGPGFSLGAVVINYGLLVFGLLPIILFLYLKAFVGGHTAIGMAVTVSIVGPIALYRWSWSLWLMCYYFFLPHELLNNRTELVPVSDDE